jgi:hypothetical protein
MMNFKIGDWVIYKTQTDNEDLKKPQQVITVMKTKLKDINENFFDIQLRIALEDELLNYLSLQNSENFRLATDLEMKVKKINTLFKKTTNEKGIQI